MSRIFMGDESSPDIEVPFNSATIVDTSGYVRHTVFRISHLATGIDSPDSLNVGTIQDTGKVIEITVAGQVPEIGEDVRTDLRRMALSDYISGTYPFGSVGLEIDEYPEMDIHPSSDRGCVILDAQFMLPEDQPTKLDFLMSLRMMGGRGSGSYRWDA